MPSKSYPKNPQHFANSQRFDDLKIYTKEETEARQEARLYSGIVDAGAIVSDGGAGYYASCA